MRPNSLERYCRVLEIEKNITNSQLVLARCGEFRECTGCKKLGGENRQTVALKGMVARVKDKVVEADLA